MALGLAALLAACGGGGRIQVDTGLNDGNVSDVAQPGIDARDGGSPESGPADVATDAGEDGAEDVASSDTGVGDATDAASDSADGGALDAGPALDANDAGVVDGATDVVATDIATDDDTGSDVTDGGAVDSGPTCLAPLVMCGTQCVDPSTDVANCGACGHACTAPMGGTATCGGGACVGACDVGSTVCGATVDGGGTCADLLSDPLHCNACGTVCAPIANGTNACVAGMCTLSMCATGYCATAGACTAGTTDALNCGACGHVCAAPTGGTSGCSALGLCAGSCPTAMILCGAGLDGGGQCVDPTSAANCGGCGVTCASGVCGSTVSASFATLPTGWRFNGSAAYDTATPSGVLTLANLTNQAGTIVYPDAIVAGDFDAQFDFRIGGGTRADGMGFMIERTSATAVGSMGAGFGMVGLNGYGVELDVYNNGTCGDVNGNHTAVDTLGVCDAAVQTPTSLQVSGDLYPAVGDIADATWRTVLVHVAAGLMTVTVSGQVELTNVPLPGYLPTDTYYFGFGGGTGGLAERQEIRNVQITFPTVRCL